MDRSTKATLSTYNTWIQLSRLQKIYHFQSLKFTLATKPLAVEVVRMQQGRYLMLVMYLWKRWITLPSQPGFRRRVRHS